MKEIHREFSRVAIYLDENAACSPNRCKLSNSQTCLKEVNYCGSRLTVFYSGEEMKWRRHVYFNKQKNVRYIKALHV